MQAWREALRASPDTHALVERQLALWPEHEPFLARSFAERNPATLSITEDTARQITHIVGDQLDEYCRGYRWMCEAVLQEEGLSPPRPLPGDQLRRRRESGL